LLFEVAVTLYPVDVSRAASILHQSLSMIETIDSDYSFDFYLALLAERCVQCGEVNAAFHIIARINEDERRGYALKDVAAVLSDTNPTLADKTFEMAVSCMNQVTYSLAGDHLCDRIA